MSHKAAAVQPLTSHPKIHPSKTNKTCETLLEKPGRTHKWCSSMDPYMWTRQCWLTSKNLFISALYGHCQDDLSGAMEDRDGWRERESQGNPCYQHDFMMMMMMMMMTDLRSFLFNEGMAPSCLKHMNNVDILQIFFIMAQACTQWGSNSEN